MEGQVLPEKLLLPIPSSASASLLSRGCQPCTEEQGSCPRGLWQLPVSLRDHCSHGSVLGNWVWLLTSSGALGLQSGREGACAMCLQWPHGAVTQLLGSIRAVNHGVPSMAWAGKAMALGLSLDRRWETLTPESACGRLKGLDVPVISFYFLA